MTNEEYKQICESTLEMFANPTPTIVTHSKSGVDETLARINKQTDQWLARQARDSMQPYLDEALQILKDEKGMEFEESEDGLGLRRIK